ncbi:hypothetical protein ACOZ38_04160 [Sphaerisporangium viridialbum]|uniref:hypothetical protein n=1 Tax=Sphaerisporangium viridialbum TaxID=46189 RepID=UPI003C75DCF6
MYTSFEEMLDTEGPINVNPDSSREQQLANIRRIYGPEKEALGVLAIEIERVAAADLTTDVNPPSRRGVPLQGPFDLGR